MKRVKAACITQTLHQGQSIRYYQRNVRLMDQL